jgi:ATP adenylyltransferase
MDYIEGRDDAEGCLFCRILAHPDDPLALVLHRGRQVYVMLNRYPYTNGHMMVVPHDHQSQIDDLDASVLSEMMLLCSQATEALHGAYGAEAFNLGMNIGNAAGAGIEEHLHMHVLPRWPGDTNFMATTANTRVIPEGLDTTYTRLKEAWKQITTGS